MDLSSVSVFPQIVIAIAITAAIFFLFMVIESLYKAYLTYGKARVAVYPMTGSGTKTIYIRQNPNTPGSITLPFSDNQLTGIEFSYSSFIYISDDTADSSAGWKTIFYKGYESSSFPLCGPGVFVSSNIGGGNTTPTLRVVMNTYDSWFNAVDIDQIPFNKWFHLAIVLRSNSIEVYINGNLASKQKLNGTLPYQNYQSLNLFPNNKTDTATFDNTQNSPTTNKMGIPPGENMTITGKMSGYISNLYYFSYAMSYSEIQAMLALGPSSKFDQANLDRPPYLIDSWWTQNKA